MSVDAGAPMVSILIFVRNRAQLLAHCVESALSQSLDDLEVVIADNASDDGTWEVCQELGRRARRGRVFRQTTNCGPVLNWKLCIERARGTFRRLLFSDDLLKPDCLHQMVPLPQRRQDVGLALSGIETLDEHRRLGVCRMWGSTLLTRTVTCRVMNTPGTIARRYLEGAVGGIRVVRCIRLVLYWIRMLRKSWWKAV